MRYQSPCCPPAPGLGQGGEDRLDSKDRLDSIGDRATAMNRHWLSRSEVLASLT